MRLLTALLVCTAPLTAVDWTWTWKPAPGEKAPTAEVCPLQYGKDWAYAVEIDDNPNWIRPFAVPFLAHWQWSDAPPGIPGGARHPFVGGVGVIVGGVGQGNAAGWDELTALTRDGWAVINHSFDHRGRFWGDDAGKLDDAAVAADAFWSQSVLAAHAGGRAPTAAIYANGYTDYNRGGALEKVGIVIATRVSGSQHGELTTTPPPWMDVNRSYLDEGAWKDWGKADPLANIPDRDGAGPPRGTLFIDFTHGIDRDAASENQRRWTARLEHIAGHWGAAGADTLWCAPTGAVADYVRLAKAARVTVAPGRLTVSVPDALPGSALSIKLTGIGDRATAAAPAGGVLYRRAGVAWLTTPRIGVPGAAPPAPLVHQVCAGKAGTLALPAGTRVAAVLVRMFGTMPAGQRYHVVLTTGAGERVLADEDLGTGWINATRLHPLVPGGEAVPATAVTVAAAPAIQEVQVWGVQ